MSLAKEIDPIELQSAIISEEEIWSDEPQLETHLHLEQIILLLTGLKWWWRDKLDFFASGNISIFYERRQVEGKPDRARGPDFFVVLNTQPKERKSWVVWQEDDRFPNIIVEILSRKTAKVDRTEKKLLYQNTFKTPEYFWFHPNTLEFAGFRLIDGEYKSIAPTESKWIWSEQLQLFLGIHNRKLRYFTPDGVLVPIPEEQLKIERESSIQLQQQLMLTEQQRKFAEQQREFAEQRREFAEQQAETERQQREQAQQQLAELEAILEKYRSQFGDLHDAENDRS